MAKLNYKIVGRRRPKGENFENMEYVDIEWTHDDEEIIDTEHQPLTGPTPRKGVQVKCPDCEHETFCQDEQHFAIIPIQTRKVIKDQINVTVGTPDSIIMQICEEKREPLAKNLGLTP